MNRERVRLVFLADLSDSERTHLERDLAQLGLAQGQEGFSRPGAQVVRSGHDDPSRDTFAIMLSEPDRAVGIGALQPLPPSAGREGCGSVILRGYSVDPRWQGRGIGSLATAQAIKAAAARFPNATSITLTVHVDNTAGQRVYEKCGFVDTGERLMGRAGLEITMTKALQRG